MLTASSGWPSLRTSGAQMPSLRASWSHHQQARHEAARARVRNTFAGRFCTKMNLIGSSSGIARESRRDPGTPPETDTYHLHMRSLADSRSASKSSCSHAHQKGNGLPLDGAKHDAIVGSARLHPLATRRRGCPPTRVSTRGHRSPTSRTALLMVP